MFYANNKNKIHWVIVIICILLYLFSIKKSSNVSIQEVSAKEATTKTGGVQQGVLPKVQSWAKEDRKEQKDWDTNKSRQVQLVCDKDCKIRTLIELGIREEIASSLVINCKALATNPVNCIISGASIVTSESGGWWHCRKNNKYNCFWIMQNNNYKGYDDATLHFAWKFQKWWRNAKSASFFYPSKWNVSPSRFCTSENSSNSSVWCPNGQKNAQIVWDKLEKLF